MSLHPSLKEILVCPQCRGELEERDNDGDNGLLCASCELLFPFDSKGGFPIMLVEEATKIDAKNGGDAA